MGRVMLDIVIVSPTPTHPHDFGNRKRIFHIADDFKRRGWRVHLVLFPLEADWRSDFPADAYDAMREAWDEVHIVTPTLGYHHRPKGDDHTIDEWWDPALEHFLQWYLKTRRFDAVLVNYLYLSKALTLAPPATLRILDTHDKLAGRRALLAQLGAGPEFFHTDEEQERIGAARADLVLAIKDEERAYFERLAQRPTLTIPFAEPVRAAREGREYAEEEPLRVGLIGGRNTINLKSTQAFLSVLAPRMRAVSAPLELILAGSMCDDLREWAEEPGVKLMGRIEDVATFYDAIDVACVPIALSTGQKIKVGEALGRGASVMALRHAFEGYPANHPWHQCETAADLADALIDLAFDRSPSPALRHASRAAALAHHGRTNHALSRLANAIQTHKPRALVHVDWAWFARDRFLRRHLEWAVLLAGSIDAVIVRFSGEPEDHPLPADARATLAKLRRSAKLLGAPGCDTRNDARDDADDLSAIFATFDVQAVWVYSRQWDALQDAAPQWRGLVIENTAFWSSCIGGGRRAPTGFHSPFSAAFRVVEGGVDAARDPATPARLFPTRVFRNRANAPAASPPQSTWPPRRCAVILDRSLQPAALEALLNAIMDAVDVRRFTVITHDEDAHARAQNLAQAAVTHDITVHDLLNDPPWPAEQDPDVLIDLGPPTPPAHILCEDAAARGAPLFRQRPAIITGGVALSLGRGLIDVFAWVAALADDRPGATARETNGGGDDGVAALYSHLKARQTLRLQPPLDQHGPHAAVETAP